MAKFQKPYPDGLQREHTVAGGYWRRHASPMALLLLLALVLTGISGALGHERDWTARAGGVALDVHAPEVLRNGEILEMRVAVTADRPIGVLVIGLSDELWRDMTVNTMIPAASDERSRDGELRFSYGPLEPGVRFLLKVDLQANPDIVLGTAGHITVYDGERALVSTSMAITVLP